MICSISSMSDLIAGASLSKISVCKIALSMSFEDAGLNFSAWIVKPSVSSIVYTRSWNYCIKCLPTILGFGHGADYLWFPSQRFYVLVQCSPLGGRHLPNLFRLWSSTESGPGLRFSAVTILWKDFIFDLIGSAINEFSPFDFRSSRPGSERASHRDVSFLLVWKSVFIVAFEWFTVSCSFSECSWTTGFVNICYMLSFWLFCSRLLLPFIYLQYLFFCDLELPSATAYQAEGSKPCFSFSIPHEFDNISQPLRLAQL